MARRKIVYIPYTKDEVQERISKFDIRHEGLIVSTFYDGRIISNVEVSEKYWSFDFKNFAKDIIEKINDYFVPETYTLRINKGAQEIRLVGESVTIKDDEYFKVFNLVNSSDKTRCLQMNIGLVHRKTGTYYVLAVENENASVSGKHFFKSLPTKLEEFFQVLPEFNVIIDKQVSLLNTLSEKKISLKNLYKKLIRIDEDGVVLPSDVLRIRMFVKNLKNAGIEFVSEEVSQHLNLLTHYQDFYNSNYDLEVNAKDVMDVFVSMYKNYDSTTIERETRRIYNALMEA
jgi:hypothetical protein